MTGLFLTDAQIIEAMGLPRDVGERMIALFDRRLPEHGRPFPPKKDYAGGRRYWPAVVQWLDDFHGVWTTPAKAADIPRSWEPNDAVFNKPRKTGRPQSPRPVVEAPRHRVGRVLEADRSADKGGRLSHQNAPPLALVRDGGRSPDDR